MQFDFTNLPAPSMFYVGVEILLSNIDNGVAQENKMYPIKFKFTVKVSVNITCKGFFLFIIINVMCECTNCVFIYVYIHQ